jgi:hypothetical protein
MRLRPVSVLLDVRPAKLNIDKPHSALLHADLPVLALEAPFDVSARRGRKRVLDECDHVCYPRTAISRETG